jgi:hypothetical protein
MQTNPSGAVALPIKDGLATQQPRTPGVTGSNTNHSQSYSIKVVENHDDKATAAHTAPLPNKAAPLSQPARTVAPLPAPQPHTAPKPLPKHK